MLISIDRKLRRSAFLLASTTLLRYPAWGAPTLTVTGVSYNGQPFRTTVANGLASQTGSPMNCATARICTDTAFVVDTGMVATTRSTFGSPQTFNGMLPTTQTFATAFNNAVASPSALFQPTLLGWKMVDGGTLDVSITAQFAVVPGPPGTNGGGMALFASVTRYTASGNRLANRIVSPTREQLAWTQAIYANYGPPSIIPGLPPPSMTNPAITLDDYSFNSRFGNLTRPEYQLPPQNPQVPPGGTPAGQYTNIPPNAPVPMGMQRMAYNDPIYGGQVAPAMTRLNGVTLQSAAGVSQLVDVPAFFYSIPASFRAIALLSAVNYSTKTITVFDDGVSYGYDLQTRINPEPSMWIISALVVTGLFVAHRRRGGVAPSDKNSQ